MPPRTTADPRNKDLGAYYTEARVARSLCRWAIRTPIGRLLDPAYGGGVFLQAASQIAGGWELTGIEVDSQVHSRAAAWASQGVARLLNSDFFSLTPGDLPAVDAVVGNPPFIRFQRFNGKARQRARVRTREAGLELPPLAGSWVAFIAHATTFLAPGGRLAMVVPAELGHAPSARPLLRLLQRSFASTTFVTFRRSLFPHIDQDTIFLLADGYGQGGGRFTSLELPGPEALDRPIPCAGDVPLDPCALAGGSTSLARTSVDPQALEIHDRLASSDTVVRLDEIARVESGYVTGANSHFHLSPEEAAEAELPQEVLVPALFRTRALSGPRFGIHEWRTAVSADQGGYLVQAGGHEEHPAVARFLDRLRSHGVDQRYKSRTRTPWYRIARVGSPPLILAAMGSGRLPLAVNEYGVAVPNTFHAMTPTPGQCANAIAGSWINSLTALSLELEGHRLGGGLLKLDPGEARKVLLPSPALFAEGEFERLLRLVRECGLEAARERSDRLLLEAGLGLRPAEVAALRHAAEGLRAKRRRR